MIEEKSRAVSLINELLSAKKELISAKKIMDKKDKHIYPISNTPFKIPNTWQWIFLSDISIIQEGPGIRKHQYEDNGIQFLTVTNILEGSVDLFKSQKYISIDEYNEKYKHYTINKGDIVTACSGATWGKSAIYENEDVLMLNTSTLRLRFFNDLGNNKFLYYLTKSKYFKSNLASHSTGQQPNYGYSHYSKIPIPIPPIEEQKRIVQILNEVFDKIDQAKANIEKNIVNAKELFQSKLNDIFSQKGDGWEEKILPDLVNKSCTLSYGIVQPGDEYQDGLPVVRPTNMKKKFVNVNALKRIDPAKADSYKRTSLNGNELLLCVRGDTGVVSLTTKDLKGANVTRGIVPILFDDNLVRLNFGYFQFISEILHKQVKEKTYGAALMQINIRDVKQLKLNVPPISVQDELLPKLNALSENTEAILSVYSNKLIIIEDLKKSILQKAFAGELTSTGSVTIENAVEV